MTPLEAAIASGDAIGGLATHFMMDMDTYVYGGALGYQGIDFYVAGRGGALGDVAGSVVAAAFVFWNPAAVIEAWDRSADVLPRPEVAVEFAGVAHRWAETRIPDDFDAARLAELAGRLCDAASPAAAPLFAGWRALEEPSTDRPKALAIHRINALRELRGALHGAAVVGHGIDPHAAVAFRTPYMLDQFGWAEPHPERSETKPPWKEAQAGTDAAMAHAYRGLDEAERAEFTELTTALQAAVTAA